MRQQKQPPWIAIGMSRASWYRHGKPDTKPARMTQALKARMLDIGVRTIQRADRVMRLAPELEPLILSGEMSLAKAEKFVIDKFVSSHERCW
jgi:hypothetical protein